MLELMYLTIMRHTFWDLICKFILKWISLILNLEIVTLIWIMFKIENASLAIMSKIWMKHGSQNSIYNRKVSAPWWRHQMETFSALLALCVRNSPVTGEFPTQRPVTRSFDVFFDLRLNQQLSKHWRRWWFETPSHSLWRHNNDCWICIYTCIHIYIYIYIYISHWRHKLTRRTSFYTYVYVVNST